MSKKTLPELEAENANLVTENKKLSKENADLQKEKTALNAKIEASASDETKHTDTAKDLEDAQAENEELKKQIEDLNNVIATAGTGDAKAPTVITHKKKKYTLNGKLKRFRLPGDITSYDAAALQKDPALVEKVLAIDGQGVLTEAE